MQHIMMMLLLRATNKGRQPGRECKRIGLLVKNKLGKNIKRHLVSYTVTPPPRDHTPHPIERALKTYNVSILLAGNPRKPPLSHLSHKQKSVCKLKNERGERGNIFLLR